MDKEEKKKILDAWYQGGRYFFDKIIEAQIKEDMQVGYENKEMADRFYAYHNLYNQIDNIIKLYEQ